MQFSHSRQSILSSSVEKLRSLDSVLALWQGGSAANSRSDERSDLDLVAIVRDDSVSEVYSAFEKHLSFEFGIDLVWRVPEPTWHGHSQRFYRLTDCDPLHLVDFVLQKETVGNRFLEVERHGQPIVYFDRKNLVAPQPLPVAAHAKKLRSRLSELKVTFPMFQPFVGKEIARNRPVDAFSFYFAFTIRPLVELLRIKHCPERFDFGLRYVQHDLPTELARELEALLFVSSTETLLSRQQRAIEMFTSTIDGLHG